MTYPITKEQFARWTFDRDVRCEVVEKSQWDEVKASYLEEADYYFTQLIQDWPCGILSQVSIAFHKEIHPGCKDHSIDQ